jgi:hypothetical protein
VTRTFLDRNLTEWEAYAGTARGGLPEPGRILFRCVSDPAARTRSVEVEGNRALAETRVEASSDEDLRVLLDRSREIH